MEDGWIKLHRKMREWQHYQNPSVRMVFEDLLFAANSKRRFFHGMVVNRGETMISVSSLEYNTGLSRKTVIKALRVLEDTGEIKRVKLPHGIKTTITGYDAYQADKNSGRNGGIDSGADSGIIPSPTPPIAPPIAPPEQEVKKERIKEDKNNISLSNESVSGDQSPDPDKSSQDKVDYVGIMNFFNRTMDEAGSSIRRCKSYEGKRKDYVRARVKQHGIDAVYEMITKASLSDFLNGRTERPFLADFEWLFRPTNFQKVLEGNYDNRPPKQQTQLNGTNQTQPTGDPRQQERANLARDYAATISRRLAEDDARAEALRKP
jgi:hypothetical protein